MKEVLLKTEKLSKSFSNGGAMQHVLRNIDLELYKGDFTVIMGASGAGKSTLLYCMPFRAWTPPRWGRSPSGIRSFPIYLKTAWRYSAGITADSCSSRFTSSTA